MHQPHDKLFKSTFSEPETPAAFLRTQIPADLAAAIDWDSLHVESGSFIDESLLERESDLLYRFDLRGEEAFLYLLFEHQRQYDPWLPLRLLRYVLRIWDRCRDQQPAARRLPPVIPVVLAQNAAPWPDSTRFHDLIAVPESLEICVLPLTPGFDYRLIQLAEMPFDKIVGTPLGVLTLRVLKAERIGRLLDDAVWDEPLMLNLPIPALQRLLYYLYHAGEIDKPHFSDKLKQLHSVELQETAMTLAEQFRQEGRQEGRQEAILENLRIRLGVVPEGLVEAVKEIRDGTHLEALFRVSATCVSFEEFAAAL